jgi:hypothetical protein
MRITTHQSHKTKGNHHFIIYAAIVLNIYVSMYHCIFVHDVPCILNLPRPNLKKEMDHFAKFMDKVLTVDMLMEFIHFSENELSISKDLGDGKVATVKIIKSKNYYLLSDSNGAKTLRIPEAVKLPALPDINTNVVPIAFKPPLFGGKYVFEIFNAAI